MMKPRREKARSSVDKLGVLLLSWNNFLCSMLSLTYNLWFQCYFVELCMPSSTPLVWKLPTRQHILSDAHLLAPTGKVNPYFFLPFFFLFTITHTTLAVNSTSVSCWLAEDRDTINQQKTCCYLGARTLWTILPGTEHNPCHKIQYTDSFLNHKTNFSLGLQRDSWMLFAFENEAHNWLCRVMRPV